MAADNFRNLTAYKKKAFALAMDVFEATKKFPKEEKYSLTDQMRRSSRSICSCIGEEYITSDTWQTLESRAEEVGKLLNHMIENPEKYQRKAPIKNWVKEQLDVKKSR